MASTQQVDLPDVAVLAALWRAVTAKRDAYLFHAQEKARWLSEADAARRKAAELDALLAEARRARQ
jgi:hypothetical protein